MANHFGGGFDDLEKAVGDAINVFDEAAKRADQVVQEAKRSGRALRLPTPGEPRLNERPSPVVEQQLKRESEAHNSLAAAIRRHEEAKARLRRIQGTLKGDVSGLGEGEVDRLQAEASRLKTEITRLNRDVGIKTATATNVSGEDPAATKQFVDQQRRAVRASIAEAQKGERQKVEIARKGAQERTEVVRKEAAEIQRLKVGHSGASDVRPFGLYDAKSGEQVGGNFASAENAQRKLNRLVREGKALDAGGNPPTASGRPSRVACGCRTRSSSAVRSRNWRDCSRASPGWPAPWRASARSTSTRPSRGASRASASTAARSARRSPSGGSRRRSRRVRSARLAKRARRSTRRASSRCAATSGRSRRSATTPTRSARRSRRPSRPAAPRRALATRRSEGRGRRTSTCRRRRRRRRPIPVATSSASRSPASARRRPSSASWARRASSRSSTTRQPSPRPTRSSASTPTTSGAPRSRPSGRSPPTARSRSPTALTARPRRSS
jgi:hypothetical protein